LCKIKKEELRRIGLLVRENAFQKHKKTSFSDDLLSNFMLWIFDRKDIQTIALYFPINSEFKTLQLMKALFFDGRKICLPIVVKKSLPLIFKEWTPEIEMIRSSFKIPIPQTGKELIPDLIISPLLSYDKRGVRLGYGGGFYDRTVAHLRKKRTVLYLGIAFPEQKSYVNIPKEDHDIILDGVIGSFGVQIFY
tara:strand:+ start:114 stop:692 length:579 start_codon:yes stop_codon:yes gene_type:complete